MQTVDDVLAIIDSINPEEWKALDYDDKKRQLVNMNALLMTIEGVMAALDRRIREFEMTAEFVGYDRHKADKEMLEKRFARVQRAATQLQTVLKLP